MDEAFTGSLVLFAGNFPPRGWQFCQGQLLPIAQYQALFSLLGTTYGGDGRSTFGLPDLAGRTPVGSGRGPGLTPRVSGQLLGSETNNLQVSQLPAHTHLASGTNTETTLASSDAATTDEPAGNVLAKSNYIIDRSNTASINTYGPPNNLAQMAPNTASNLDIKVGLTGSGAGVNNVQPSLVINYIICLNGIYPSRN